MSTDISIGITKMNMSRTYKLIITYINYFFNKISNIVSKKNTCDFCSCCTKNHKQTCELSLLFGNHIFSTD